MRIYWLHGWAADSRVFNPLIESLSGSAGLEPVPLDLPGFGQEQELAGESFADSVIRRIGPEERVLVAGWSLGAMVALETAPGLAGRLRGLVLVSGCGCFCRRGDNPHGKDPRTIAALSRRVRRDSRKAVGDFLAGMFAGENETDRGRAFLERFGSAFADLPAASLVRGLDYLAESDLRAQSSRIDCPVLLIHGELDRIIDIRLARALAAGLGDSRLVEMEGFGHAPFWHNEKLVARLIEDFIGYTGLIG